MLFRSPDKNLSSQTRASTEFDQVKDGVTSKAGSTRVSPSTGEAFVPGSNRPTADQSSDARVRRALAKSKILYPLDRENKTKPITTFEDLESSSSRRPDNFSGAKGKAVPPLGEPGPNSSLQSNLMSRSPFIEESNSSPVYAGWDDTLRQFVVTNKFTLK